jgi:two-component system, OmpR family, sensor histidine kinase KdpD
VVAAGYKDGNVILRVSDKGPGFPPAELEHVFNKFFRANERRTGGLGLGLSIVKGFAEAHKGSVLAANRPGGGSEVTVTIPSDLPDITDISTEKSDV